MDQEIKCTISQFHLVIVFQQTPCVHDNKLESQRLNASTEPCIAIRTDKDQLAPAIAVKTQSNRTPNYGGGGVHTPHLDHLDGAAEPACTKRPASWALSTLKGRLPWFIRSFEKPSSSTPACTSATGASGLQPAAAELRPAPSRWGRERGFGPQIAHMA